MSTRQFKEENKNAGYRTGSGGKVNYWDTEKRRGRLSVSLMYPVPGALI